jgi:deferrochelatase/peroxidase EfeB
MSLLSRSEGGPRRSAASVELDDIQATVLRYRPEPYYGTHIMLHIADAAAGRELLRRLTPYIDSAADWWQAGNAWTAVAITYPGLVALGVPADSLESFPETFRQGMAARSDALGDTGPNNPQHSELAGSTFSSASSATTGRSGTAPWRRRGSSIRACPERPYWRSRTSAPSPGTATRSATRT